jgi:GDP-L-fucose synthase
VEKNSRIYVAGHHGMVGSAIVRRLKELGYTNLILPESIDLRHQDSVDGFFHIHNPEYVFLAAAKVGGIMANSTYPAEFIYDNLMIAANIISASHWAGVRKLLNLGSSCIYPKHCPQPMKETYLLTGPLEPTNEAYAVAKITALKMCQYYNKQYDTDFITVMPTNLYGPGDNFNPETSHVLPAMIGKFYKAKMLDEPTVILWGTGSPLREFLYVDDLARACIFLMETSTIYDMINVGSGYEIMIRNLARMVQGGVGFRGKVLWDTTKPDGTPRKLLDCTRIHELGWKPSTPLEEGIKKTYDWFTKLSSSS